MNAVAIGPFVFAPDRFAAILAIAAFLLLRRSSPASLISAFVLGLGRDRRLRGRRASARRPAREQFPRRAAARYSTSGRAAS